jgi:outer membrane protein insertion porin family
LLGRGLDLTLASTIAAKRQQFDITFVEPYFLDRNVTFTNQLYHTARNLRDYSSFDTIRTGGAIDFGYVLAENWNQSIGYSLRRSEVFNIQSYASRYVKEQEGTQLVSSISHSLAFDTRDSRVNPTDGILLKLTTDIAGLGGDTFYLSNVFRGDFYYPVDDEVVLKLGGTLGNIQGYSGDKVRISDRFFIGGDNFRGFNMGGVGPRDYSTNDALGAQNYAVGTVQVAFPSGLPKEIGVDLFVFNDFGTAWGIDSSGANISDSKGLRAAAGVGFNWRSPFGLIGLYLAYPYLSEKHDDTKLFGFNLGTKF